MRLFPLYSCFALSLAIPGLCYRLFDSRDALVRSVIEQCVSEIPKQKEQWYYILRCITDNTPSEFFARWSSGASVLAFIPTITALLSNSIDEVSSIADQSTLLAILLSLSSVTAFIHRFRDKANKSSDTVFTESSVGFDRSQAAWTNLEKVITPSLRWLCSLASMRQLGRSPVVSPVVSIRSTLDDGTQAPSSGPQGRRNGNPPRLSTQRHKHRHMHRKRHGETRHHKTC